MDGTETVMVYSFRVAGYNFESSPQRATRPRAMLSGVSQAERSWKAPPKNSGPSIWMRRAATVAFPRVGSI